MVINMLDLTLYAITDSKYSDRLPIESQVEQAIKGGATIIQYREKSSDFDKKKKEASKVLEICRKYNVPCLINDDVRLAGEIDADGVHLGQGDMSPVKAREILGKDKIIGVTAKTIEQAKKAQEEGADYLGSGAVFGTSTKLDAKPLNHEDFQRICESVSIPVVAIGGIDASNISQLKGRKMAGFAIVSGIFGAADIYEASKELRELAAKIVSL